MNTSTTASTTASTSVDLGAARAASLRRVRETWTRIIQHYSQVDDTYGDIVDLHTGAILRDNGHLRSMGDAGSLWRADVGVDLVSGHEKDHNDNSDNQHGQFNIQGESLPDGQHSTRATGNAVSGPRRRFVDRIADRRTLGTSPRSGPFTRNKVGPGGDDLLGPPLSKGPVHADALPPSHAPPVRPASPQLDWDPLTVTRDRLLPPPLDTPSKMRRLRKALQRKHKKKPIHKHLRRFIRQQLQHLQQQ